jgi:uncharacterized SAM-binding protein YcdF (DUF218 family)
MESILLFAASKIAWALVEPGNLLLLALTAGAAILNLTSGRRGRGLVAAAVVGLLALAILPTGSWLALPLENRFPIPPEPIRVDGIVVLGGAVSPRLSEARRQISLNDSAERMTVAVALARRYPEARLVVSGGDASVVPNGRQEATAMAAFLVEQGIDPARIVLEDASRNTYENAMLAKAAAHPLPEETWLLVTSAMHMPRAVGCFRHVAWTGIIPYPVDYRTRPEVDLGLRFDLAGGAAAASAALKEWIGLAAYRVFGRTDALFPAP